MLNFASTAFQAIFQGYGSPVNDDPPRSDRGA